MSSRKFQTGAWVFWTGDAAPILPDDAAQLATTAGVDVSVVPEYAGDRVCATRVFARAGAVASKRGWLLRPILRTNAELAMGIVAEKKDAEARTVKHHHDATATWAEANPEGIAGDHSIAQYCDAQYKLLRNRLLNADWTATLTNYVLSKCGGTAVRDDGRVYWVPPQKLDELSKLDTFLKAIGLDLVIAEIEPVHAPVVERVASGSLSEKIAELKKECDEWDGTQKPGTYARRIEEYTDLRKRATMYQAALGIAVDDVTGILTDLEQRATRLLEIRQTKIVHRNGSVSDK